MFFSFFKLKSGTANAVPDVVVPTAWGPLKGPWWGPGAKPWRGPGGRAPGSSQVSCILTYLNGPTLGTFSLLYLAHFQTIILTSKPILDFFRGRLS